MWWWFGKIADQAGWIAGEEDIPACLPALLGMSQEPTGSYLYAATLQRVQSQSHKHKHIKTVHVAASPQEPHE